MEFIIKFHLTLDLHCIGKYMINYLKFTLISLILFSGCREKTNPVAAAPKIIGGMELPSDHPGRYSIVALQENRNGKDILYCSGVLIAEDLVATAAHCTYHELEGNPISVYFGNPKESSPKHLRPVTEFKSFRDSHRENVPAFPNFDIAILRFDGGLPDGYRPIPILPQLEDLSIDQSVYLTGYGLTSSAGDDAGQQVLTVAVKVEKVYNHAFAQGLIAYSGGTGRGSCNGDSGGPMYVQQDGQWYVAGIANGRDKDFGGSGRCEVGQGIYTSLSFYKGWAAEVMNTTLPGEATMTPAKGEWATEISGTHDTFSSWCLDYNLPRTVWDGLEGLFKNWGTRDCQALLERITRSRILNGDATTVGLVPVIEGLQKVMLRSKGQRESLSVDQLQGIVEQVNRQTSVTELTIDGYELPDITPLAGLLNIKSLAVRAGKVQDISPLASMKNLETLDLAVNQIEDVSALGALTNLKELSLRWNKLTDVTPLGALVNLQKLDLSLNNLINKSCPIPDPDKVICGF